LGRKATGIPVEIAGRRSPSSLSRARLQIRPVRVGAGSASSYKRGLRATPFEGRKVAPRFMIAALVGLSGRLSLIGSFVYEGIATGAGSLLSTNINLGGYQLLGGLCYRIF
jgi:hypothetical protein